MMEESGIDLGAEHLMADGLAENGKTPLYFAQDGRLIGLIAVADTVKPSSAEAMRGFRALGIDVVMLTGDNQRTADAIGRELGVTKVIAEVLPQDKEAVISSLQTEAGGWPWWETASTMPRLWPDPTWGWLSAQGLT